MNRKIILFGVFLSVFILILVPSIGSVNANIQNENNLNIKNFDINYIKKIKNKIVNSDCDCQKTTDNNSTNSLNYDILCTILIVIAVPLTYLMDLFWRMNLNTLSQIVYNILLFVLMYAEFYECDWMGE